MTRDCGQYRRSLLTFGEGGSGYLNLTGTRSSAEFLFDLTCSSIQPRAVFPASVMDSRVPNAHGREALALCDLSGGFWDLS
ncbi:unnamed protein product, partial [Staurois parvus]